MVLPQPDAAKHVCAHMFQELWIWNEQAPLDCRDSLRPSDLVGVGGHHPWLEICRVPTGVLVC